MFLAGVLHWSGEWLTFGGSITHQVLFYLLAWNIFMALFNLIPAFPMDGGRVLRAFLAMGFGQLRGTEIAVAISKVLAVGFIVVGFYWHEFFLPVIGLFLMVAGSQELAMLRYQARQRSRPITIDQPPMVRPAEPTFSPAPPTQPNFSGFLWDARAVAWIEWRNGQAVGATYVNGTGPR
jgi:hypothetical protein